MYISNLIYKCYKWNKYWWMLYLFHLNIWKRNYLLYANKIYGLEPDTWKIGHGIFYENYFLLLNFSINCPVLYDFIHVYSFFSSCYCILGDFFSIVYTYIIFFSLSCNRTDCLHSLLKRNDLYSSTKWNLFSRLYYVICNCH